MKKYIILMQMWLACVLLMTACSDLDEQVEQLMVQKEQTETIAPNETDKSVAETKTVEYTNVQAIALTTHGTLKEQLGDNLTTTDKLILSGPIDATDVDVFRNQMTALKAIDMTDVTFVESDATYKYSNKHISGSTASLKVGIIPEAMFGGLDNFIEIKLPKEVTQLGTRAFEDCSSLQTIELPENLETLGKEYVFGYCSSLTSIVIPEKIEVITYSCFVQCSSLKTVTLPQNLKGIEHEAFSGCSALSSIELPKKMTYIDELAFSRCSSLESITIPASVTSWGVFFNRSNNRAFANCTNLSTIILEEGLTVLGSAMFYDCTAVKQIEIPSTIEEIPLSIFAGCSALEKVVVNQGVEKIGEFAFSGCKSLTSIDLPEGLLEIGNSAFDECPFTVIDFLPNSLKKIGNSVFNYNENLTTVILPNSVETLGASVFSYCSNLKDVTLSKNLKEIGNYAFSSLENLTTVILPNSVETLGAGVFQDCNNLKDVTLSKNLKEIGDYAFESTAIETITLPETLTTLGYRTFFDCKSLKEIKIPELVTVIPGDCFLGCSSMVSVTLPDGITHIEDRAFNECNALTNVKLPASLTFLGYESFCNCWSLTLTSPMLPESLTTMEGRVFHNDHSIKELVFPAGLSEIAEETCWNCHALERVVISEGTTKIATSAFKATHALTEASITLPSTMKVIGAAAFENAGITSLSFLSDGIETIDSYAFMGCPIKDKVITLPSITSIGSRAFEGNMTIGAIRITGTQDVVLGDIFGKASNCLIYASGTVTLPTNEYIYNKIANGRCLKLRLVEDSPWYCPEAFAVGMVTLTKQFNHNTNNPVYAVSGKASNWYAFNMPFVPDEITSADGRTWAPFNAGVEGAKPFWLRKLTTDTKKPFVDVTEIEADVPYIISFPCNENYDAEYNLCGDITFTATNITIPKTGDQIVLSGPYYSMFSSYEPIPQASSVYLLNSAHYNPDGVRKDYYDIWGSAFEQSLRESWSWEPYISFSSPTTTRTISLDGASTRSHKEVGSIPSIDDM